MSIDKNKILGNIDPIVQIYYEYTPTQLKISSSIRMLINDIYTRDNFITYQETLEHLIKMLMDIIPDADISDKLRDHILNKGKSKILIAEEI